MGQTVRHASLGSTRLLRGESRRDPYERPSAAEFYDPQLHIRKKKKPKPKKAKAKRIKAQPPKAGKRERAKKPARSPEPPEPPSPDIGCLCGWRGPSSDFENHTTFPVERSRKHGRIELALWTERRETKQAVFTEAKPAKQVG